MKRATIKNLLWGLLLIIILIIASHYDYKYMIEDEQVHEAIMEENANEAFNEIHY